MAARAGRDPAGKLSEEARTNIGAVAVLILPDMRKLVDQHAPTLLVQVERASKEMLPAKVDNIADRRGAYERERASAGNRYGVIVDAVVEDLERVSSLRRVQRAEFRHG